MLSRVPFEEVGGSISPPANGRFRKPAFAKHSLDELFQVFREGLRQARIFELPFEAQESAGRLRKALNPELSGGELFVLIAKGVPMVSRSINFFQRHVAEPTEAENVEDLEKVGGRNADR